MQQRSNKRFVSKIIAFINVKNMISVKSVS